MGFLIWANLLKQEKFGGEGGIRTLDSVLPPYSLSRGAPSATRPPLRKVAIITNAFFESNEIFL